MGIMVKKESAEPAAAYCFSFRKESKRGSEAGSWGMKTSQIGELSRITVKEQKQSSFEVCFR